MTPYPLRELSIITFLSELVAMSVGVKAITCNDRRVISSIYDAKIHLQGRIIF